MMFRKRRAFLVGAAVAALALTGCAQEFTPSGRGVSIIALEHGGRQIPCAVAEGGGIDCDWEVGR